MNFETLRKKYKKFIYESYDIDYSDSELIITFHFEIEKLTKFNPVTRIPKKIIKNNEEEFIKYLVFHIGLIEMISYYKCCCPENIIIKAGYLDDDQIKFLKKLMYYGLGEFLYTNHIHITEDELVNIQVDAEYQDIKIPTYNSNGNLILIGGGKDSNVTLEILKDDENDVLIQNPKLVMLECAYTAGYKDDKIVTIKRTIDKELLKLNELGYLNGHTPFSSLIAFESFLVGYLMNKKYIVLSNEESSNEGTVIGTKINHQYSKSYEFENDFNNYTRKYFKIDLNYFSFLRPLSEYQIGMLFSHYDKYHPIFKSCNKGSKKNPWEWCCNCSKCLFVYIILSPFLYKEKLINIFGEDLFEKESLLLTFQEIIGETGVKPFECVGSYMEARYALSKTIKQIKQDDLPYLLKYYKEHYALDISSDYEHHYNQIHNLPKQFEEKLKEELIKYDR